MISKAEGKSLSGKATVSLRPRLSAVERGLLKWAVVDPGDRVLDANVGTGAVSEYLRRNLQCEVCGVSDSMDDVRQARSLLQTCDIVYASAGDIPWREASFDTVLFRLAGADSDSLLKSLREVKRVLKEGGQLLLGASCCPAPLKAINRLMTGDEEEADCLLSRRDIVDMLSSLHFEQITWQRTGVATGVVIAWKRNPAVAMAMAE